MWHPLSATLQDQIEDHLTIKNPVTAASIAKKAVEDAIQEPLNHKSYVKALSRAGQEAESVAAWEAFYKLFPDDALSRDTVEEIAWGVIRKHSASTIPYESVIAMLALFFSRDIQGVHLVQKQMFHGNAKVRELAVQLSTQMQDAPLKQAVQQLFFQERVFSTRIAVIKAVGAMRLTALQPQLEELLTSEKSSHEEKLAALAALVALKTHPSRFEVTTLLSSKRSFLRLLGCNLALYKNVSLPIDSFLPLLEDNQAPIRSQGLRTLGLLFHKDSTQKEILLQVGKDKLNDPNEKVAITALWLLTLLGEKNLPWDKFLTSPFQDNRILAASALSTTGDYGAAFAKAAFYSTTDPFVKLNLALGMIEIRQNIPNAASAVFDAIKSKHPLMMHHEELGFRMIKPTTLTIKSENTPLEEHQLCQLELLNMLAILEDPRAHEGFKQFLSQRNWSVGKIAAAFLLTEGSQESIDLIKALLNEQNSNIKLEAALLLALWGKDSASIEFLQKEYVSASRNYKERILEAIGSVGSMEPIPFLIECLKEPYPVLRMMAASAILQCANH